MEAITQQAKSLQDKIVSWRRDLHRMPELRMETPKTEAYIASQLREMGIRAPERVRISFAVNISILWIFTIKLRLHLKKPSSSVSFSS